MNETMKTILERRSIRSYTSQQLADADLQAILNAGLHAPNARNQQIWHFSVIQNQELLDGMVAVIKENILNSGNEFFLQRISDPNYHTFYHAPTVVIISGEKDGHLIQVDCGTAAQTMAIAAASLGIGSCVIASSGLLFLSEKGNAMKKDLGIPEGYDHVLSVALGYLNGEKPAVPARNTDVIEYIK